MNLLCWAHRAKAGLQDPVDLRHPGLSLALIQIQPAPATLENGVQIISSIVQRCVVYKSVRAGRLMMKRRLVCTILWSKCGWRGGECYVCLRSTAAVLSSRENTVVLFVVHTNSTMFSSSNFFVTITHTKLRCNSTKMYFLSYKNHCIPYKLLMCR